MRTNFVLFDGENVKPEFIERLNHASFRVFVFVGANLKQLDFTVANALQSLGSNGNYVQISGNGPNALDFHIAYYIGKLSADDQAAYFHIISKDAGFDPLINHLKDQNILCSRWTSVLEIPLLKSLERVLAKQRAEDFYEKHIAVAKSRPPTVKALKKRILSHFSKRLSAGDESNVVKALAATGCVVLNGNKVAYPDRDDARVPSA